MKIDIHRIIFDHLATLVNANTKRISIADLSIFFGLPLTLSLMSYLNRFFVGPDFYNISITFFGIFIALLLNIQVAVFGIFLRKWEKPEDKRYADQIAKKAQDRNILLREVNTNISYLVLISFFALIIFLVFYTLKYIDGIFAAFSVFIYSHFLLTLLMIIKRSHAIFQGEYLSQ